MILWQAKKKEMTKTDLSKDVLTYSAVGDKPFLKWRLSAASRVGDSVLAALRNGD
jgi:hypothetical protein